VQTYNQLTQQQETVDRKFKNWQQGEFDLNFVSLKFFSENRYYIAVLKFCIKRSIVRHLIINYEISCKVGILKLRGHKFSE